MNSAAEITCGFLLLYTPKRANFCAARKEDTGRLEEGKPSKELLTVYYPQAGNFLHW